MKKQILENYPEDEFLFADGFDEAIIGVDERTMNILYSVSKCYEILEKDMTEEEAMEYFDFNVRGSYVGEHTPIWCNDNFERHRM